MEHNYFKAAALTIAAALLCGCGGDTIMENSAVESFVYEETEGVRAIASEKETLYTLQLGEEDMAKISALDVNGSVSKTVTLSNCGGYEVKCIAAENGVAYAAVEKLGDFFVYSVDFNSETAHSIGTINDVSSIDKIAISEGNLYWIGNESNQGVSEYFHIDDEGVTINFSGTKKIMGCIDIETGENTVSNIALPITFSASENGVTVYGFDEEGGYYFADYQNPENKNYNNKLGSISSFDFYAADGAFAFIGSQEFSSVLPVSKCGEENGVIKIAADVNPFFASELCCSDSGFIWIATGETVDSYDSKFVKRYNASEVKTDGKPVRIISNQYIAEKPYSLGQEIDISQLNDEGFALTVLSLDQNYDLAMVSSDDSTANDIKTKGSFYPLNEVEGVSEYLDKCFPYVKDAVTDSEGNICMLPILIKIPVIAYNEKNCAENGIEFSTDLQSYIDTVKHASEVSEYYDCTRYWLVNTMLSSYLADNDTFDTDEFRNMAKLLKEQTDLNIFRGNFDLYPAFLSAENGIEDEYYAFIYEKTLFMELLYNFEQQLLIPDINMRAAPLPNLESGKNMAVCTFLCVNPYSDRLSETLAYISQLAEHLSCERNSLILSDKTTYEDTPFANDLYNIYLNGEIYFHIPSEIYSGDFDNYCSGQISLDDFINEADRKLSVYLNE